MVFKVQPKPFYDSIVSNFGTVPQFKWIAASMLPGFSDQWPESIFGFILQSFPLSSLVRSLASTVLVYIYSAEC